MGSSTISFYFYATASRLPLHEQEAYLQAFLTDNEHLIVTLAGCLKIPRLEAKVIPNDSKGSVFDDTDQISFVIDVQLRWFYYRLDHAVKNVHALQAVLEAVAHRKGLEFGFEYHLNEGENPFD